MRSVVLMLVLGGALTGGVPPTGHTQPDERDFFADRSVLQFIILTDLTVLLADRVLDSRSVRPRWDTRMRTAMPCGCRSR
jgi:hypothetical protein